MPFFEEPAIQLRSLARLPTPSPRGATRLRAEWRLTCWLRLPWAPYIDIEGNTTYMLNEDDNQVGPRRGGEGPSGCLHPDAALPLWGLCARDGTQPRCGPCI